jgi:hypothetical protein
MHSRRLKISEKKPIPDSLLSIKKTMASLFELLASSKLPNFARREGLRKKLDKWKKTLLIIQKCLMMRRRSKMMTLLSHYGT